MATFYRSNGDAAFAAAQILRRRPVRVSATLGWQLHQDLLERAGQEGRSLSNLIAYLLERAMAAEPQ